MASRRRILKELEDMQRDTSSGMRATVVDETNLNHLHGCFKGPPDTPYEGGEYVVDIQLPDNYPFSPPKMKFFTRVWHPNVSSQTGAICLDILSNKWSPVLTIKTALLSLQALLAAPEPNDPQDAEVANMMLKDPARFKSKARDWAIHHAGAPSVSPSSSSGAVPVRAQPVTPEEEKRQQRLRELQGYDESVVGKFVDLGFSVRQVVEKLRIMGVRPGERVSEEMSTRVVEKLLGL
ncbi:ubiquitin-conjugating enzyme/RWD-like protein [Kalaharituber pfeilii]|nr:ubiquitin-conjugating enzyme/RWD-like protein [Kalaharituber pfeilii]